MQSGIELEVGNRLAVPVTLQVGSVSQEIVVNSAAAQVDTEKSSISEVISERSINSLPLNGRVATQLVLLTGTAVQLVPGNANPNVYDFSGTEEYPTEFPVSIGGGAGSSTNWLFDGIDNMASAVAVNNAYPFPDALQEFDVETSSLSAREGVHPGGVVNMVTKSGSNQFHGDLFEYLRNGDLDGVNYSPRRRIPFGAINLAVPWAGPLSRISSSFSAGTREQRTPQPLPVHLICSHSGNAEWRFQRV